MQFLEKWMLSIYSGLVPGTIHGFANYACLANLYGATSNESR